MHDFHHQSVLVDLSYTAPVPLTSLSGRQHMTPAAKAPAVRSPMGFVEWA